MPELLFGIGLAVVAAISLAVQSLTVRVGTKTHSVHEIIAVMYAVNLLVLVPVAGVVASPHYGVTPRSFAAFVIAGLLGSFVARYCYFIGISRLGASRTEPLKALFPMVAVGAAVVVLGEPIVPVRVLGVVLLLVGGIAVTMETRASPATSTGRQLWVDTSFPLSAAVFLGVDPIFTKFGLAEGTSALVGATIRILAASAGFGLYFAWRMVRSGSVSTVRLNRWLVAASVANTAYLISYYAALQRAPVSLVAPLLGISTLFVVIGAAVFLQRDERVTWRLGGAAALVVSGVVLVVQG